MNDRPVMEFVIDVIECLIKEIEGQGSTTITTNDLRKFIHNMENGIRVEGKNNKRKIDV